MPLTTARQTLRLARCAYCSNGVAFVVGKDLALDAGQSSANCSVLGIWADGKKAITTATDTRLPVRIRYIRVEQDARRMD